MPLEQFLRSGVSHPELSYLVSSAVGFAVSIVVMSDAPSGLARHSVTCSGQPEGSDADFCEWYSGGPSTFFCTPLQAAVAFVHAWQSWRKARAVGVSAW